MKKLKKVERLPDSATLPNVDAGADDDTILTTQRQEAMTLFKKQFISCMNRITPTGSTIEFTERAIVVEIEEPGNLPFTIVDLPGYYGESDYGGSNSLLRD
jgi:hypothetical protein